MMACSKNEVLDFVKEYAANNERPCPKKDAVATHGEDALGHLKALVDEGILGCRRGRNGGYFFKSEGATSTDNVQEADNAPQNVEESQVDGDALAEQFAALEARLAAAEAAEQNEQAPF
jgi:hypothetical protein